MRVAVTGASGFVGGWVARELTAAGHDVHAFGRRPADRIHARLPNYRQWDITSGPIRVPHVDAVVHCAALVGQWGESDRYEVTNVAGTRHVLSAFDSAELFVYVSTSSVYGPGDHRRLSEDAPIGASTLTAYARTKAEGERLVSASAHRAIILRPHIVYGPGDTTLLPRLVAARRRGTLTVPGNGTNRVSVTHIRNLTHGVERALAVTGARGTFNIADDDTPTVDALLRTTFERLGLSTRLVYIPRAIAMAAAVAIEGAARLRGATREPLLTRYVVASLADEHTLNTSRARESLGYDPRHRFRDADLR